MIAVGSYWVAQRQEMTEIRFDLGKNIVDTARASGVPQFEARDVAGLISYSISGIPATVPARYTRVGYEVVWQPVFALTMYADGALDSAVLTESANLQLHANFTAHGTAHAFVEQTIAQFLSGRWKRYHDPAWDVLLTGRSSILDETGQISSSPRAIDPSFRVPASDWPTLVSHGPRWEWIGEGVLATLEVSQSGEQAGAPLTYKMNLVFELLDRRLKREADRQAQLNKEGDAKGWNTTAEYEASRKARAELNMRLVANAVKRGDAVVAVP